MVRDPELESRRRIHQTIQQHPGLHFRELLGRVALAQGTLQYHLHGLEADGLVAVSQDGGFTRYYATTRVRPEDRPLMDALRREYARRILAHLVAEGPLTTQALSERIGKAPSTVSWHISRLVDAGLLTRTRAAQEVRYALVDRDRVLYLYTTFRGSFTDRLVDRLLGLWDSY
ncbi:MAG: winged helix-turn-helix transcriptional regulator [Candidatus Thermoplasmatota archaeon]